MIPFESFSESLRSNRITPQKVLRIIDGFNGQGIKESFFPNVCLRGFIGVDNVSVIPMKDS
jgi:hypothetical protein